MKKKGRFKAHGKIIVVTQDEQKKLFNPWWIEGRGGEVGGENRR